MWLINTTSLELENVDDAHMRPYAILSHTWEKEEVTFRDMRLKSDVGTKLGYEKIVACCKQEAQDGLGYAWVDTCWSVASDS